MIGFERRQHILRILADKPGIRVTQLAEQLAVSEGTIRNDLTALDGATGAPAGEIIEFSGTLYDRNGRVIPNATIEIWQTDANGVYLHPDDPSTAQRDVNFQFYGEAVTDENGRYAFRTVFPGEYEPRPRHIHFKVKLDGETLITSQFYFASDNSGQPAPLIITLTPGEDGIQTGQRDIILNVVP